LKSWERKSDLYLKRSKGVINGYGKCQEEETGGREKVRPRAREGER